MSKVAIVYWSGTGNTEAMASAVTEGVKNAGADAVMLTAAEFDASMMDSLEESEFAPMFQSCEEKLKDKKIALFGSYGWGDGEWMRNWEETCINDGASLACDSVICNEAPDDDAITACKALGKALA